MPTYGYRCQACHAEFDLWQRMSDPPISECPSCGGGARRLFFPAGIVFKGGGFYKTDSRSGGSAASTATNGSGTVKPSTDSQAGTPATPPSGDTTTSSAAD